MPRDIGGIADLLSQASTAHHHYEQTELKGVYDQDWATWYAQYVVTHGLEQFIGTQVPTDRLSRLLAQSTESHKQEKSEKSWADYTAQRIVDALG